MPQTKMPQTATARRIANQNPKKSGSTAERYFGFNIYGEFIISNQLYASKLTKPRERFCGLVLQVSPYSGTSFCAPETLLDSAYTISVPTEEIGENKADMLLVALRDSLNNIDKLDKETLPAFRTYAFALIDIPCENTIIVRLQTELENSPILTGIIRRNLRNKDHGRGGY